MERLRNTAYRSAALVRRRSLLRYWDTNLSVICWIPSALLPRGSLHDNIVEVAGICLDDPVVGAQVTLHPELIDWRGVVHPNLEKTN